MSLTINEIKEELKNGAEGIQSDLTLVTTETANLTVAWLEMQEARIEQLKKLNVQLAEGFIQNNEFAREQHQNVVDALRNAVEMAYWELVGIDPKETGVAKALEHIEAVYLREI